MKEMSKSAEMESGAMCVQTHGMMSMLRQSASNYSYLILVRHYF